jgi:hypothetical protein
LVFNFGASPNGIRLSLKKLPALLLAIPNLTAKSIFRAKQSQSRFANNFLGVCIGPYIHCDLTLKSALSFEMEKRNPIIRSPHHQPGAVEKHTQNLWPSGFTHSNMLVGEKCCVRHRHAPFPAAKEHRRESIVGAAAAKNIYWCPSCVGDFIYILLPLLWQFFLISSGPNLWSSVAKKYYHRRTHTLPALNSTRDTNKYV